MLLGILGSWKCQVPGRFPHPLHSAARAGHFLPAACRVSILAMARHTCRDPNDGNNHALAKSHRCLAVPGTSSNLEGSYGSFPTWGTLIYSPKYYSPHYWDPLKKVPLMLGNSHILWQEVRKMPALGLKCFEASGLMA